MLILFAILLPRFPFFRTGMPGKAPVLLIPAGLGIPPALARS